MQPRHFTGQKTDRSAPERDRGRIRADKVQHSEYRTEVLLSQEKRLQNQVKEIREIIVVKNQAKTCPLPVRRCNRLPG